MNQEEIEIRMKLKNAEINRALGFFILFFGVIVTFAMIYSETRIEQMTCLTSGLTLVAIGGGMMLVARKIIKKQKKIIK
jgi:hypothetical protein